jgi:hypothetical protein
MPKFYVRDGNGYNDRIVLMAHSPLAACIKAVNSYFDAFVVGGWYWVSEKGFSPHLDDVRIEANDVNDILIELWKEEENI